MFNHFFTRQSDTSGNKAPRGHQVVTVNDLQVTVPTKWIQRGPEYVEARVLAERAKHRINL